MKDNFNDVVYRDEEMTIQQKLELLNLCRADYEEKLREIYNRFSPAQKAEMLHLITSAQLVILNKFSKEEQNQ